MRSFRERRIINRRNRYLREAKYQAIDLKSLLGTIFNLDWLDIDFAVKNNLKETFNYFVSDFTDWLVENGYSVADDNSQPKLFDTDYNVNAINRDNISDLMEEYLNDDNADRIWFDEIVEKEIEWLEEESERAVSTEYTDFLYRADSGAADKEFYYQEDTIDEVIDNSWDSEDGFLGFENKEDLKEAVLKACEDNDILDIDTYDAGGYGNICLENDEKDKYFTTGYCWLGNGEEEEQLETAPLIPAESEIAKYKPEGSHSSIDNSVCCHGDCIYGTCDTMYVYGVKMKDVIKAGRELGYL